MDVVKLRSLNLRSHYSKEAQMLTASSWCRCSLVRAALCWDEGIP